MKIMLTLDYTLYVSWYSNEQAIVLPVYKLGSHTIYVVLRWLHLQLDRK